MLKNLAILTTALSASLLLSVPAVAMTASQKVEVERQVTQPNGDVLIVTEAPNTVVPGDTLIYTVDFHNDKEEITENFRIDMPVPTEVTYIEGTAVRDDAVVLYSVDGGLRYEARNVLTVETAEGETRSAVAEDITHIRWTLSRDVMPGDRGEIKFKGQLK